MLRKTDAYLKRVVTVWERGYVTEEKAVVTVRRETWWLFWLLPVYSCETVVRLRWEDEDK